MYCEVGYQWTCKSTQYHQGMFFPRHIRLAKQQSTFFLFSQLVCLTKAYNFCHQVAIRWTIEKRDRAQQFMACGLISNISAIGMV